MIGNVRYKNITALWIIKHKVVSLPQQNKNMTFVLENEN